MPQVKHIVLMKFKPETTDNEIGGLIQLLEGLKDEIPGMLDYCGGPYSSPEGFNRGFTHGFIMTFESVEARDNYLPHEGHQRAAEMLIPLVEQTVAFDFEA